MTGSDTPPGENQNDETGNTDANPGAYGTWNRLLLGISAGFALCYLLTIPLEAFAGLVFIKGMGVFLLAVVAWNMAARLNAGLNGRLLALALLLSSLGDVFLRLDPVGMFVHGLGSFLVAHLIYVGLFLRLRNKAVVDGRQRAMVALFIIYGLGLGGWMMPHLGAHMVPVLVYAAVITVMGVTCVLAHWSNPWVFIGAVLFISSDTALAIDKFMMPLDGIGWYIWPSYYIGQLLIMTGVIARLRLDQKPETAS